jgi:Holliday junction resolvase RusA-like endonuclease
MAIAAAMSEDRGPDWWPRPPAAQDIYVRLTLDLEPVPKERHRTSAAEYTQIGTQRVKTRAAHSYTPQRLEAYEAEVGWLLRQARVKRNDTDDLGVHAVFHVRGHQPDIDNLVKSLFDACNGVAWRDDRQVTCLTTGLVRGSDHPHTALMIYVAALAGLRGMA